jgi:hypothetical protein
MVSVEIDRVNETQLAEGLLNRWVPIRKLSVLLRQPWFGIPRRARAGSLHPLTPKVCRRSSARGVGALISNRSLLTISPRTTVNKGMKKGRGVGAPAQLITILLV